ncbi:MAG: dephospho-CoA kinase [Clostridia bacterium]|nr:dephospho-CoA kinase [Clostridia bacterium]
MIIGLTGGSGAGKSKISDWFKEKGYKVIDGDKLSRKLCERGEPTLKKIIDAFGEEYLTSDGQLNRKKLGGLVFSDSNALKILEQITHTAITEATKKELRGIRDAVIEGAALHETEIPALCDFCIFVSCPPQIRLKRIMERDDLTEEYASNRLSAQKPDDYYRRVCKYEVVNDGEADTTAQLLSILKQEE